MSSMGNGGELMAGVARVRVVFDCVSNNPCSGMTGF